MRRVREGEAGKGGEGGEGGEVARGGEGGSTHPEASGVGSKEISMAETKAASMFLLAQSLYFATAGVSAFKGEGWGGVGEGWVVGGEGRRRSSCPCRLQPYAAEAAEAALCTWRKQVCCAVRKQVCCAQASVLCCAQASVLCASECAVRRRVCCAERKQVC